MTEVLIAGGVVGLLIAFVRKLDSLTHAHFEWKLVELRFAEPQNRNKNAIKAKAPRKVRAPNTPAQLKSVKRLPR